MIQDLDKLSKDLEGLGTDLKAAIDKQKKSIAELDMPQEQKKELLKHIGTIESSVATGDLGKISQLVKNIANV